MKRYIVVVSCLISLSNYAGTMGEISNRFPWFASIGTGYSWAEKPGLSNPDPSFWDHSIQGYNGPLTDVGFYSFAIGKQVYQYMDLSISYLNHENSEFQWFQTGTGTSSGFSGVNRTRYFTLNNRSVLANIIIHNNRPIISPYSINISPYVSAGIGAGFNKMTNFHTVGTVMSGANALGSVTSIGNKTLHTAFAWQGSVGVNIQPDSSSLSANVGYRYYDGGSFKGPNQIYSNNGGWGSGAAWTGKFIANQLFFELKYTHA